MQHASESRRVRDCENVGAKVRSHFTTNFLGTSRGGGHRRILQGVWFRPVLFARAPLLYQDDVERGNVSETRSTVDAREVFCSVEIVEGYE